MHVTFPYLEQPQKITLTDIVLLGKSEKRNIMRHSGLHQPRFYVFNRDEKALDDFVPVRKLNDQSFDIRFTDPKDILDFRHLSANLGSAEFQLPLVYKPNSESCGEGVIFLDKVPEGVRFTMCHNDGIDPYQRAVREHLDATGINYVLQPKKGIFQFILPLDAKDAMYKLWHVVTTADRGSNVYDSGMIEEKLDMFRPGSFAYETRLALVGDISSGQVTEFIREPKKKNQNGSYARIGRSEFISNWASQILPYNDMFNPIFEVIGYGRRQQFASYADLLVENAFVHFCTTLTAAGIKVSGNVNFEMDLMWIKKHDIFEPALIEYSIWRTIA